MGLWHGHIYTKDDPCLPRKELSCVVLGLGFRVQGSGFRFR